MSEAKTRFRSTFYYEGKQYEATGKSQREADQKAALKLDKLKRGEIGISGNMTVKRWATEWLETYKKHVLADKQYKDYKRQIEKTICPEIGAMRVCDVKDVNLQKILNAKAGLSQTRIKMLHITIRGIFKQARISRIIMHDPSEYLIMPKATKGTHRSLTDVERAHFLSVAETHHAGLMFKTMLYCGLRTGEVVALSWKDIDFEAHEIKVSHAMESGSKKIKSPKTAAGVRRVPIPNDIYRDLLARKGDPFDPVFVQVRGGKRHTESSRGAAWDSIKKAIDISMGAVYEKRKAKDGKNRMTRVLSVVAEDLVPYCLRHTYCTDLQSKGISINVAKYLMGHNDISVTASIYTHMSEESLADAAKKLNAGNHDGNEFGEAKSGS